MAAAAAVVHLPPLWVEMVVLAGAEAAEVKPQPAAMAALAAAAAVVEDMAGLAVALVELAVTLTERVLLAVPKPKTLLVLLALYYFFGQRGINHEIRMD
jgi:hypothetical protein